MPLPNLTTLLYYALCLVHTVDSSSQDIMDGLCEGLPSGYSTIDLPVAALTPAYEYTFLKTVFQGCKYALGGLKISKEVHALNPSTHPLDFLLNLTRVGKTVSISMANDFKPTGLENLVAIGRYSVPGQQSLAIFYTFDNLQRIDLYSLRAVEVGNIQIFTIPKCFQMRVNLYDLIGNSAEQQVSIVQLPCSPSSSSCSASCSGNCWEVNHASRCQTISTSCHLSCLNGCFGRRFNQCCSVGCTGGCKSTSPNDCFKYAECPVYSDVNGECLDQCRFIDPVLTTSTMPVYNQGYILYKMFCLSSCPESKPFFPEKIEMSTGIFEYDDKNWVPLEGGVRDPWVTVRYRGNVLFYYAIISRNNSQMNDSLRSDVYFFTSETDEWDRTGALPDTDLNQWDLCSYSHAGIWTRYLLRCMFGNQIRLISSIGITSSNISVLMEIDSAEVFGYSGDNIARTGTTTETFTIDGEVKDQLTDPSVEIGPWWYVRINTLIQLSHAIIYTSRGYHCSGTSNNCYERFSGAQFLISVYNYPGGPTASHWQICSSLDIATSHRYVLKSCDSLYPFQTYPYMHMFGISSTSGVNLSLAEVEIYPYERENLGFFTHYQECVRECPDGYQPDGWRNCTRCDDGVCDKYCDFGNTVYSESNYMSIEQECTHVTGHVILVFGNAAYDHDLLTAYLSTIRQISGSLIIRAEPGTSFTAFTNLSMFRNLEVILGVGDWRTSVLCPNVSQSRCNRTYSLVLELPNLLMLELPQIVQIRGSVYLNTPNLCQPSLEGLLHVLKLTGWNHMIEPYSCSEASLSCHIECYGGCYGTNNTQCTACPPGAPPECRMCKNYQMGRSCVPDCGSLDVYEGTNQCGPCHDQCAGECRGPLDSDCVRCRYAELGGRCLDVCPSDTTVGNSRGLCLTDTLFGFNYTAEEEEKYKVHLVYDGMGQLSWFVEILSKCYYECQKSIESLVLEIEYTNKTLRERKTLSTEQWDIDLRTLLYGDTGDMVYGVKLLIKSGEYGLMDKYYPLYINISGLFTTTTDLPTTTTDLPTTTTDLTTTTTDLPTTTTDLTTTTTDVPTTTTTESPTTTTTDIPTTTITDSPTTTTTDPPSRSILLSTTTVVISNASSKINLSSIRTTTRLPRNCCKCIDAQKSSTSLSPSIMSSTQTNMKANFTTSLNLATVTSHQNDSDSALSENINTTSNSSSSNASRRFITIQLDDCVDLHDNRSQKKSVDQIVADYISEDSKGGSVFSSIAVFAMVLCLALVISGCTCLSRREKRMRLLVLKQMKKNSAEDKPDRLRVDNPKDYNALNIRKDKKTVSHLNPIKDKEPKKSKKSKKVKTTRSNDVDSSVNEDGRDYLHPSGIHMPVDSWQDTVPNKKLKKNKSKLSKQIKKNKQLNSSMVNLDGTGNADSTIDVERGENANMTSLGGLAGVTSNMKVGKVASKPSKIGKSSKLNVED